MTTITGGLRITGGFHIGPTTGGAMLPVLRWDTTYANLDLPLAFDNNNTTIFDLAPGSYSAITTNKIPMTGAYMFSLKMDYNIDAQIPDIGGRIGLGNRSFNNNSYVGADTNSISFSDTGLVFFDGSSIESGFPNFNVDAVRYIDVAVLDGNYVWIRVNGGNWNNDPSSNLLDGTGGYQIQGLTGLTELYPMASVDGDVGPTQFDILSTAVYGVPSGVTFFNMYTPPSKTLGWDGIYWEPVPVGQLNQINLLYTDWDGSTIYWEIFGGTSASGDFDPMSGTITGLTGSGSAAFYTTPQIPAALHTYYFKFGSTPGGSDLLVAGPYSVRDAFTINVSDLAYATVNGTDGTLSGDTYVTNGSWPARMAITGDTALESTWNTFNGQQQRVYAATWANGALGYVYLEPPGATGGWIDIAPCDSGAGTAAAGTWQFPVVLSPA